MALKHWRYLWIIVYVISLIWSAYNPADWLTWAMEVAPALLAALLLALTFTTFRLTPLLYALVLFHCIILMIGGHYTYAEVPFFEHLFGAERNNYDKVGHFVQGFVPAVLVREVLLRKHVINGRHWLNFIVISICLAVSALYELLEWWAAVATGDKADAFLGTQGYIWDTQSDMALALLGAIISLIVLTKTHDKQLNSLQGKN